MNKCLIFSIFMLTNLVHGNLLRCDLRDGGHGFCVPIQNCEMTKTENFVFFPDHFCPGDFSLICCDSVGTPSRGDATTTEAPPLNIKNFESHPNYNLFDMQNCGVLGTTTKIAHGEIAEVLEFPWTALIGYERGGEIQFNCGGTLISENYVISAAHCLVDQYNKIMKAVLVRLGEHTKSTDKDCHFEEGEEIYCADSIQDINIAPFDFTIHKDFNHLSLKNDIALIRLPILAKISQNNIEPICMPFNPKPVVPKLTVIGFGRTEKSGRLSSDVLMKVHVDVHDNDVCSTKLRLNQLKKLEDKQICAGDSRDSCKGDSGSSLEGLGKVGNKIRKVQYGIVSYGTACGSSEPGVYTNVHYFLDWILDNMRPFRRT